MAERSRIKLPSQKFIGRPINAPNCCGAHDVGRFWIPPLLRPSVAIPIPPLLTHPNLEPTGNACHLGFQSFFFLMSPLWMVRSQGVGVTHGPGLKLKFPVN